MPRAGPRAIQVALLLVGALSLAGCGDGGSGWFVLEAPPSPASTTVSLGLGEEATLNGPNSLQLRVSLDFTSQPPVPISLSPEDATFLEIHLSVTNTGTAPFSGVLADAADLAVVPSGTLAPVRTDAVPSGIALSGGLDFGGTITIAPGSPTVSGKVIFQIDPEDTPASFSLTLPGGTTTARWAL
jgi:hypothetical protein